MRPQEAARRLVYEPSKRTDIGMWIDNCHSSFRQPVLAALNSSGLPFSSYGECFNTMRAKGYPFLNLEKHGARALCQRHRLMVSIENNAWYAAAGPTTRFMWRAKQLAPCVHKLVCSIAQSARCDANAPSSSSALTHLLACAIHGCPAVPSGSRHTSMKRSCCVAQSRSSRRPMACLHTRPSSAHFRTSMPPSPTGSSKSAS